MNRQWKAGIEPHRLTQMIGELYVSDQVGGSGDEYRHVRRDVEITWLANQNFDCIISLLPTTQNLINYEKSGLHYIHHPLKETVNTAELIPLLKLLKKNLALKKKILIHRYRRADCVAGIMASFFLYYRLAKDESEAILRVENLFGCKTGEAGRNLVKLIGAEMFGAKHQVANGQMENPAKDRINNKVKIGIDPNDLDDFSSNVRRPSIKPEQQTPRKQKPRSISRTGTRKPKATTKSSTRTDTRSSNGTGRRKTQGNTRKQTQSKSRSYSRNGAKPGTKARTNKPKAKPRTKATSTTKSSTSKARTIEARTSRTTKSKTSTKKTGASTRARTGPRSGPKAKVANRKAR